jgi:hypothetical protein
MDDNAKPGSSSKDESWQEVTHKLLLKIFGKKISSMTIYIFEVEWLTPVGKINLIFSAGMILIFIILAFNGIIKNSTPEILFAIMLTIIINIVMSCYAFEAAIVNKLKKS